jgi:TATA-box binding protein (TBP) (component of TFIID and TFIIIB)
MCKDCFQTVCVCNDLYDEILSLQGYTSPENPDVATCLNLTIETFIFAIGTKHCLNSKGRYENGVVIDINNIARTFEYEEGSIFKTAPKLPIRYEDDSVLEKKTNTMYNQIEFKAFIIEKNGDGSFITKPDKHGIVRTQESRLSVMIFTNGSVKVTGVRNPKTISKVSLSVLNMLKKPGNLRYLDQEDPNVPLKPLYIWDTMPAMINTIFRLKSVATSKHTRNVISKKNLQDVLNSKYVGPDKQISMINNRKFQMNIKFKGTDNTDIAHVTRKGRRKTKNEVTILVFYTGKFSIIGTTSPDSIKNAYRFVCDVLRDNPSIFDAPKRRVVV